MIKLALESLSDEQITHRRDVAQKLARRVKLTRAWSVFGFGGIPALSVALLTAFPKSLGPHSGLILSIEIAILVVLVLLICAASWLQSTRQYVRVVELLAPIAGTSHCAKGLFAVETGGPHVQAWRDEALGQRGQLYVFDVEIMEALRREHVESVSKSNCDALLVAACRKLHTIPS